MKRIALGNKQLRISDDKLAGYLSRGYIEIDDKTGKPKAVKPPDKIDAAAVKKLTDDNARLTEVCAVFEAKIAELEAALAAKTVPGA